MTWRPVLLFCVLVYLLSWTIQIGVILEYSSPEDPRALPWLVGVMFTPALVTLGFALSRLKLGHSSDGGRRGRPCRWQYKKARLEA